MKSTIVLIALGLCSVALTGCETSNRGPYDRGINEGPVGRGGAVVVVQDRQPDYRDNRGPRRGDHVDRDYRSDRNDRNVRNDRRDAPRGRKDRVGNDRNPCPGDRDFDPRRDRCNR